MKLFNRLFTHNLNYENFIHKISHNLKRLCSIALVVGGKLFRGEKNPIMNRYVKKNVKTIEIYRHKLKSGRIITVIDRACVPKNISIKQFIKDYEKQNPQF